MDVQCFGAVRFVPCNAFRAGRDIARVSDHANTGNNIHTATGDVVEADRVCWDTGCSGEVFCEVVLRRPGKF